MRGRGAAVGGATLTTAGARLIGAAVGGAADQGAAVTGARGSALIVSTPSVGGRGTVTGADGEPVVGADVVAVSGNGWYLGRAKWMAKTGTEWLYRFAQEPRRMGRRYFIEDAVA